MKKIRGNKRRLSSFKRHLTEGVSVLPPEDIQGCGYWHLHMPCSGAWIDQSINPTRQRKECVATILEATKHLSDIQPNGIEARVICCISWPELWSSQIIVFFGTEYFDQFFSRNTPEQTWERKEGTWVEDTLYLELPSDFEERIYHETITDEDLHFEQDLVFIGDFTTQHSEPAASGQRR